MSFPVIDCQVHAYERDHPGRPWIGTLPGPAQVTGDDMVAAMDAVGVDGALLISPWSMYRYDPSYALEVYAKHAARFALIKPFDPQSPSVEEEFDDWAAKPGVVGGRIMIAYEADGEIDPTGFDKILGCGAKHSLPINLLGQGHLDFVAKLAKRNANTQIVVDHVGIKQPFEPPPPAEPFAALTDVLALAEYDNVAIKISGACTLSHKPFPYPDIWDPLWRIFDAFGLERCLWGTDWTRATGVLTYEQGVEAFRVSDRLIDSEREQLMGRSLAKIYNWSPKTD